MDDLSEKLADILNDPESMNRVRQMAESLLGSEQQEQQPPQPEDGSMMPSGDEIKTIMSVMSMLKDTKTDARAQLLNALRPHLSEPRREKVDTAIKIMRLIEILPYIKESGLLNFML